ncbi:6-carboxytetrahydropterin synthase QueD [Ruminococcus sp. NK3A76]|uniref:6-carboxytetrahydropterin synthase QueD n=1 Tax=Ruminococcus sp. NK3A76 TaxID=877411 RepID=UPI000490A347|nr:6-carboxytetrahydropterin synthase QueD [Ruminococcus sp. NK3A76]
MNKLITSAAFDSAHFLAGYKGKCSNIHGHRWKAEVTVCGEELITEGEKRGMLIDFADLKSEVRALADKLDHTLIYEAGSLKAATLAALKDEGFALTEVPFRPTAENFAKFFFDELTRAGLRVCSVRIYETPDNCAEYEVAR